MSDSVSSPASAVSATEDNTPAILSYITIIGFIVAIILHGKKKTAIGTYHLRQALGLMITWFAGSLVMGMIPFIGWILLPFFTLAMIVVSVIGIINAANRTTKPLPVLGEKYAEWFSGAFA